ncbi:hypothetical protein JCM10207_002835 [Rhodosporidiobolus poonsookiae]
MSTSGNVPLVSERYKADPFPVPRSYSSSPEHSWLPRLFTYKHSQGAPPTSTAPLLTEGSPPSSPTSSPPFSPTAPISSPHLKPTTSWFSAFSSHFYRTHAAMAQSEAELVSLFPDASGATHALPLIPNERRSFNGVHYSQPYQVAVEGELTAIGAGFRVEVWSAEQNAAGFCEVGPQYPSQPPFPLGVGVTLATDPCMALAWSHSGRYLWVGTLDGQLFKFDTARFLAHPFPLAPFQPIAHRKDAHPSGAPVIKVTRFGPENMCTVDASGRIVVWFPAPEKEQLVSLHGHSMVYQLPADFEWCEIIDGRVWATWNALTKADGGHKEVTLRVFDISQGPRLVLVGELTWYTGVRGSGLGRVTSACVLPSHPELVFTGHDSGDVGVWSHDGKLTLLHNSRVSLAPVTALVGPSRFLWVGYNTGYIDVIDVKSTSPRAWTVVKRLQAHKGAVVRLGLDSKSLWTASTLRVFSSGDDRKVKFWDGLLRDDWLIRRMSSQVALYCSFRPLKVDIFSWNVDGQNPDLLESGKRANHFLLGSFLTSLDKPDLVVFNFQELIDLSDLSLATRTVLFATPHHDVTGRYKHWRRVLTGAVEQYLGADYVLVTDQKLVGLYTAVFARREVKAQIRDLAAHHVKNGFDETYGNKGSILLRLVIGDSCFCFINSHLAAGKAHPAERERDLIAILDGDAKFPKPLQHTARAYVGGGDGTAVADCEMVFFAGDLNFRLSPPREKILEIISTSASPAAAASALFRYDELTRLRTTNPSFRLHSFTEAPVCFLPTYKYDYGTSTYDTSAKQRAPAWCDRILWRAERAVSVTPVSYGRFEADISDHKPVAACFDVEVRTVDAVSEEVVYRRAVHEWAAEEERLLETARTYYPPQMSPVV